MTTSSPQTSQLQTIALTILWMVVAYLVASIAIDSGNLLAYAATVFAVAVAVRKLVDLVRRYVR